MNIVEKYNNIFTLEEGYFFIELYKESNTTDVWSNKYIGEVFICKKDTNIDHFNHYVVVDPYCDYYNAECYIQCGEVADPVGKIIDMPLKKPVNWSQYRRTLQSA
jgi:hypothetical protein